MRDLLRSVLQRLDSIDQDHYGHLLEETQRDVVAFTNKLSSYQTADLGNALRASAWRGEAAHEQATAAAVAPLQRLLAGC